MRLDFSCTQSKIVRIAGDVLSPIGVRYSEGDVRLGHPSTLIGGIVPGVDSWQNTPTYHPLDGGGGVRVRGLTLQAHSFIYSSHLRTLDSHCIRSN